VIRLGDSSAQGKWQGNLASFIKNLEQLEAEKAGRKVGEKEEKVEGDKLMQLLRPSTLSQITLQFPPTPPPIWD